MEDMLFKTGIVLVGVVIIVLLMTFAITSLSKTDLEDSFQQAFNGNSINAAARITLLCENCLSRSVDRDCYMLNLTLSNTLSQSSFTNQKIILPADLPAGAYLVKISNRNARCELNAIQG